MDVGRLGGRPGEIEVRHPGLPVLVLSQHVEQLYARELLADGTGAVGYLLKDRVFDADQFIAAVRQVAAGGTAMDPTVIAKLLTPKTTNDPLATLTDRGSSGGVFVDNRRVSEHRLRPGDVFRVGDTRIRLE